MKIRKANLNDVNGILKLEKEWKKENISWGIVLSKKKELIKEIKKQIYYIAEEKNEIIGYIQGEIIKSKKDSPTYNIKKSQKYGELHAVYIKKKFRDKHIGESLVNKLLNDFKKQKLKIIKLKAVSKNNKKLINFYKKFGFEERIVEMILGK